MSYVGGGMHLMPFIGTSGAIGGVAVTVSATPPAQPGRDGRLWWSTTIWRLFISYQDNWVQVT